MADLAAVAGRAGQRLAVDDQAAADADLARDEQDVVRADGRAPAMLGQRAEVGLVRDRDRDRQVEVAVVKASPSGTSRQPRFGAIETSPSERRTTPTTPTPDPDELVERPGAVAAQPVRQLGQVGADRRRR